jgi:hypothetical protein
MSIVASPSMQVATRTREWSASYPALDSPDRSYLIHWAMLRASRTTTQPVSVDQVVSMTRVPGSYRRLSGAATPRGANRNRPALRSSSAPNVLGESNLGRQNHSTDPSGATRAEVLQSERKP